MNLPETINDITPEFVTEALRSSGVIGDEHRVVDIECARIGEGVGVLGQLARLRLTYDRRPPDAPGSVIAKLPSEFAPNRSLANFYRFYEREGRMYEHVLRDLPCRTPRAYLNVVDPEADRYVLLIEDFHGRAAADQVAGIDLDRARLAVLTIAAVHGQWWGSPRLDALEWLPRIDDPIYLASGEQYRLAWPRFLELFAAEVGDAGIEVAEHVQAEYEELFMTAGRRPLTVCHGDFRADNLLFDLGASDAEKVAVLDWQISARGPGVADIAYLLCQSMSVEDRRRFEHELLEVWYAAVASHLGGDGEIPDYSLDDALADYRRSALVLTVFPVAAGGQLDPANERGRALVAAMARRAFAAAVDHDASELYPSYETAASGVPTQRTPQAGDPVVRR